MIFAKTHIMLKDPSGEPVLLKCQEIVSVSTREGGEGSTVKYGEGASHLLRVAESSSEIIKMIETP